MILSLTLTLSLTLSLTLGGGRTRQDAVDRALVLGRYVLTTVQHVDLGTAAALQAAVEQWFGHAVYPLRQGVARDQKFVDAVSNAAARSAS